MSLGRGGALSTPFDVVTGAFSYTGRAIAARLLDGGREVLTLTRRPGPATPGLRSAPFSFDDPAALAASLEGAETFYNTYWVRFQHGEVTFARAAANTRLLLAAARQARIRRFVHISVTHASRSSPLPYFHWKGVLEGDVAASGLPFAIVRPTLIFGSEDILVNNIAWLLRHAPVFPVPGRGDYRVQPVSVEDTAALAVGAGDGETLDAAGPETYTFAELVRLVARAVGARARIVHAPPGLALRLGRLAGRLRGDVILTDEELTGLMRSLLVSHGPPTGRASFREWLDRSGETLGRRYVSELRRNYAHAAIADHDRPRGATSERAHLQEPARADRAVGGRQG